MTLTIVAQRKHHEADLVQCRSLTTADLALLREPAPPYNEPKVIRDKHHHIAWLLALGKSQVEIAAELHISPTRVSQHQSSPAFRELIEKKRQEIAEIRREEVRDLARLAAENMVLAETEIQTRLRGSPSYLATRDLNRIASDRMDRFGFPKHSTSDSRSVNLHFAAHLEAAISRSRKAG